MHRPHRPLPPHSTPPRTPVQRLAAEDEVVTAPALTLRWSLRDGALPDETCDGVVRVSQLADERGPFFAAVGEGLPWRGTSRVSAEMAARDWLRQTARGIDAEVMLTLPDGRPAHDAPFVPDPVPPTFAGDAAPMLTWKAWRS